MEDTDLSDVREKLNEYDGITAYDSTVVSGAVFVCIKEEAVGQWFGLQRRLGLTSNEQRKIKRTSEEGVALKGWVLGQEQ